ncbi:DUF1949 domain-containing protein [Clostridium sp. Ade.TY]|uniref:DUF1949 domain-containing protein n=1 Tax=Clostridium sp. Ade.TY TaxID=1391647 RepID=UPI000429EAF1|nr:DUF1949 domain-containing protein [Clostridium sp. Ade.TY]
MVSIDNFVLDSIKRLESLKPLNCLDIRSYKKNRKVIIEKLEDSYNLYEDGFHKEEFYNLNIDKLKKLLKTIEKREFPRSNKLRFYILDSKDSSVCRANYREEIEESEEDEDDLNVFIECDYSIFSPIRNIIESNDGNIDNIDFSGLVSIKAKVNEALYKKLKDYTKDNLNANMYAC